MLFSFFVERVSDSYVDKNIIILTDDCQKLMEMEKTINRFVNKRIMMAIVPKPCPEKYRFNIFKVTEIDVNKKPLVFPSGTVEKYIPRKGTTQVIFLHDSSK